MTGNSKSSFFVAAVVLASTSFGSLGAVVVPVSNLVLRVSTDGKYKARSGWTNRYWISSTYFDKEWFQKLILTKVKMDTYL